MKIIIFGASGMVGQGVLKECLLADDVKEVTVVGRKNLDIQNSKLKQVITADLHQTDYLNNNQNFDACFFCLGISASGLSEQQYHAITYDLTIQIAKALETNHPNMTFIYVSGSGTDSSEQGKVMWARVKGKTENALLRMNFKAVYLFRPAIIQPLDGIQSKTKSYRLFYKIMNPILPLIKRLSPHSILTTSSIGVAMLNAVRSGYPTHILEVKDIAQLASKVS